MATDSRFVLAPNLQEYFIDKDTGLPLSGGKVYFYSDVNRSVLKDVYQITGTSGNYDFSALPNPMILSSIGTFQDSGNDILIYYFPFEGNKTSSSGKEELYFIRVFNSNDVEQFTRQGFPGPVGTGGDSLVQTIEENFIPNGQFLAHNNLNNIDPLLNGIIPANQPVTNIAPGGWTFERPSPTSTAVDSITFPRFSTPSPNPPTQSPRYQIEVKTTSVGSPQDTFKYLCIKWNDVNKFSSDDDFYTFGFTAKTLTGTKEVQLRKVKYYGTGGTPHAETDDFITSFTIDSTFKNFSFAFTFGSNDGNIIGTNNDDYVQLAIAFPPSETGDVFLTDFFLSDGKKAGALFHPTTNADMLTRSVPGWMPTPDPDGDDLYLPMVLTAQGAKFDHSIVGKVYANSFSTPAPGEVKCDGSKYLTNDFDQTIDAYTGFKTNIPFSRLQNVLFNSTLKCPIYGTGRDFVTAYTGATFNTQTNLVSFYTNQAGPVTAATAETSGFTIATQHIGDNNNFAGYPIGVSTLLVTWFSTSLVFILDPGTTTFVLTRIDYGPSSTTNFTIAVNTSIVQSSYFVVKTGVLTSSWYQFWFDFNNNGTAPSPISPGTNLIRIGVYTGITAEGIMTSVANALSGFQITNIQTIAASGITNGSYFKFSAASGNYFVWFNKDGLGIKPTVPGTVLGIEVPILSADTAAQVAQKIVYQSINFVSYGMNGVFFAVPDLRGMFLRGFDPVGFSDPDYAIRASINVPGLFGAQLGTFELDSFSSHSHTYRNFYLTAAPSLGDVATGGYYKITDFPASATTYTGSTETRPVNTNVQYVIHL